MPRLASAIREDKLYPNAVDPWENYPAEVACTKTSALGATCTLRYHEFSGSGMGQATEAVRVAADGRTYEAEEHGEIQKVGE
jgi:hypothetical protein